MKRIFSVILAVVLMLAMTACGGAHSSASQDTGDSQAAVSETTQAAEPFQTTQPPQEYYDREKQYWDLFANLENNTDGKLTLSSVQVVYMKDGTEFNSHNYKVASTLASIGLKDFALDPGQSYMFTVSHPATGWWNECEYTFNFTDANGEAYVIKHSFENLKVIRVPKNKDKDINTLRHDNDYEEEVYPEVFWVPASSLGESRYTNDEILQMTGLTPQEKQAAISTLYEALQLFQLGGFNASNDNVRTWENGINWEHHKPGYHAVRTNKGSCATSSNWLSYLLKENYDEMGFFATSQDDGSGHVYNYIYQDGWYYFIDLTHYIADEKYMNTALEDGDLKSYRLSDHILGNIHKTKSIQSYVNYILDDFHNPPGIMFMYSSENVLALDGLALNNGIQITYEDAGGQQINVVYDNPSDSLTWSQAPSPKNYPDWSQLP